MSEGINIYVADIETTGLLNGLLEQGSKAKLHNLAVMDVLTPENGVKVFHAGNDLQEFLSKPAYFIMHNGIGYDKEALEILGYDTSNITFIDTLALSYYLYLDRDKHGLESWGEEFGVPKPEIKDWESLTQADYDHRVTEDVKINYTLYQKMFNDLAEVYVDEIKSDADFVNHRLVKYLNFKMVQLAEQASTKTKIDVKLAVSEIARFEKEIEEKNEALKLKMPKVEKIAKRKPPANPFKRNGELSVTGERWKELTESVGVTFDFDGQIDVVVGYDEPNPNSSDQLKKWLFSLGWKPETLKYVKDKETGKERTIPQLYIPKSGGKLCPSIEKLVRVHPQLEELEGKSILVHRKGVCQGFVDSLVKLDGQGEAEYVEASAGGFTNTLRLKHRKPLVNLPSVNAKEAENVRACLMAKEGNAFFGADLSGLETILKFNFMLPHDPDFVYEQMKPDYDPHLDIAVSAEMMTQSQCDFYKIVDKGEDEAQYEKTVELVEMLSLSDNDKKRLIKDLGIIRHSAKQAGYSCLPMDTTVLTPSGFKEFKDLSVGDVVYSFKDGQLVEDEILHTHFYKDAEIGVFGDTKKELRATLNHRWLTEKVKVGKFIYDDFLNMSTTSKILTTAPYIGGSLKTTVDEASLIGWLLSDGCFTGYKVSISQSINKFVPEIDDLLERLGLTIRVRMRDKPNGNTEKEYNLRMGEVREIMHRNECVMKKEGFNWSEWVLKLNRDALEAFLHAFWLADGLTKNFDSYQIYQNEGDVADAVMLAMYLIGDGRVKMERPNKKCKLIRKHQTRFISTQRKKLKRTEVGDVFCLTTHNSNFVIKQDNEIMITGNCQYGAGYKAVSRSADVETKIAKQLVEGYRAKNWSIQKIADEQYVKECSTGKWLWNPLTKLYYRLVSDKDRFSTLIQGTGSYMLDMWVGYSFHIRKKEGLEFKQNATFHDEKVWEFVDSEEMREKIVSCSNRALDMLNKQFKLEIPIKASHDYGERYSEIH